MLGVYEHIPQQFPLARIIDNSKSTSQLFAMPLLLYTIKTNWNNYIHAPIHPRQRWGGGLMGEINPHKIPKLLLYIQKGKKTSLPLSSHYLSPSRIITLRTHDCMLSAPPITAPWIHTRLHVLENQRRTRKYIEWPIQPIGALL